MSATPLLSIIIPTRNRQQYCIAAIDSILAYPNDELELCIQDNSDDNQIEQHIALRHSTDSRLKYRRIDGQLNSLINIANSYGLANGQFIMLIGDDDTILPSIFDAVQWMDQNQIDSLAPSTIVDYYWPGAHPIHKNGWLTIPQTIGEFAPKEINVQNQLKELFDHGTISYLKYKLPKSYHGIVRRELMEQIKSKTGNYSGGLSPDIYACIALSSLVNNHYTTSVPISIAGACRSSTTAQNIDQGHRGELSSMPHLHLRGPYEWDKLVPAFYSVDTVWAESALKAVTEMEITGLRQRFNCSYMAAFALLNNRSIFKLAWSNTFTNRKHKLLSKIQVVAYGCLIVTTFFIKRVKAMLIKTPQHISVDNVQNIGQAVNMYLNKINYNENKNTF